MPGRRAAEVWSRDSYNGSGKISFQPETESPDVVCNAEPERRCRFVWLETGLALLTLEPIVLVAQTLDFFGLLLHFGRQVFYQVHQSDDHLAHRFILDRVGVEVFYHSKSVQALSIPM